MNQEELFSKEVILANGARVLLSEAISTLVYLNGMAADPDQRVLLRHLRESCLSGDSLHIKSKESLVEFGLLPEDGIIPTGVRDVVLAAVRGTSRNYDDRLYIDSPFTDSWDRTISELIISRLNIRTSLPSEQAELLIQSTDEVGKANTVGELKKWSDFVRRRFSARDLPPPSPN